MKKQIKRFILVLLTSLMVIAPIGNLGVSFNQIIITYAAKSTKKKSSTTKKKNSSNNNSIKKSTTKKSTSKKSTAKKKSTTSKKSASSNNKVQNHSSSISDNTICYVSDGGECYHRLSSCAGKLNQQSTTVGRVKGSRSKCRKCW